MNDPSEEDAVPFPWPEGEPPPAGYFRTGLVEDIISNLEMLCASLAESRGNPRAWKWVIISADMLVTSALVRFNKGSEGIGALHPDDQQTWWQWLSGQREGAAPKQGHVAGLAELLTRSQQEHSFRGTPPLVISSDAGVYVLKLHKELRNGLTHFGEDGWSIGLAILPDMLCLALGISRQAIAATPPTDLQEGEQEELERLLAEAQRLIAETRLGLAAERQENDLPLPED